MSTRFTRVRDLGEGGQGRVVAVRDAARGGQTVALKETTLRGSSELRAEFELLACLRHPNLVPVYDWFYRSPLREASGEPGAAYSQEYVEGPSLWLALQQRGAPERVEVFKQMVHGLPVLRRWG